MLHNTGAYGANETPVNMGAPLNISQLPTPMKMVQNLNSLGKMPQQPPQATSGHFNLPSYPSYGNPPVNVSPQMHPFQNYHSLGFQSSYMPERSSGLQNAGWPASMLPMSMNMHTDHTQNMLNYPHIDRRMSPPLNSMKEPHFSQKMPLNIPQVPNKLYQTHSEPSPIPENTFEDHYKPYNTYKDGKNVDLSIKSPESLLCDNTRRKNLENTVRLIENILINTTKNREMELSNETQQNSNYNSVKNSDTDITKKDFEPSDLSNIQNDSDNDDYVIDDTREESDDNGDVANDSENVTENISDISKEVDKSSDEVIPIDVPIRTLEVDDKMESENEAEEVDIKPVIKQELIEVERQVIVKIEQISSWTDTDSSNPFHRDVNGVTREDTVHDNIVDGEVSEVEALAVINNGMKSDSYYECPHCCLLFRHPKRFLIHVKWHSFGLINKQRIQVAKQKVEKREAARLERLEAAQPSKRYTCKQCDKDFHSKRSLDSHRHRCHANRVRECKLCDKRVSGWAPWKAHLASHNTESGYQCNECPKRFKYSHSLAKHKDTHLEKTHACPECPKKFGSPALLKVHMKSHERAQKGASFHCTFCGKSFYDKFNLQIHERTHTNERPFVCEICNATFGCNSNLSRHLKVSHSAAKPHVCSTCSRSFATALIRDRHALRVHGDPEEFKYVCKQCPSRYLKLVDLRKHTYKMHPKPKVEKPSK